MCALQGGGRGHPEGTGASLEVVLEGLVTTGASPWQQNPGDVRLAGGSGGEISGINPHMKEQLNQALSLSS